MSTLTIHTDGASRGNPGAAAFAYVIARDGADPVEEAGRLGRLTNNQAEYTALVRALEHAARLGTGHALVVHSDSELMVKQMKGEYRVKNDDLQDLYAEAKTLAGRFPSVTFRHVRREFNTRADELCNEALDGLREPSPDVDPTELAVACLREAKAAWGRGAATPTPEEVWGRLKGFLSGAGARRSGRKA